MRTLTLVFLLIIGLINPKPIQPKTDKLDGVWIPVRQEMGGNVLPKAAFEKQKLTVADNSYTFVAESVDKGEVKYADGKMDLWGKDGVNKGRHFMCIYKMENGQLFVCYNLTGDGYPTSYDTKPRATLFLSVFEKEK